jgi:RNA polymerase sigma factor (sigma-70 family)
MAANAVSCATLWVKHRYRFPMHDSEVVASIALELLQRTGLAEAYDRYADPLYKYCLASLGEPAEAADAVQGTFVIAAARLAGLREPDRLRAWLYAVARNECQRITRPGRPVFAPAQPPDVTADAADVREDAERARLRGLLDAAAAGLAPGEREVIELELRQGLAAAEAAAVLGVARSQANALASRARGQLEACLGALAVARAGQRDCGELSRMLAGWDGRLTVPLRRQLHRHIGRCAACSTRRDLELHPGRLLGHSPGQALAAAAADSLRAAAGPPDDLRTRTLALAAGQDPAAIAHRAAVLGQAGTFDSHGFPKPVPGPGKTPARRDEDGPGRRRGRAAAAGAAAAAVIGAVAFTLAGSPGHGKLAGGQPPGSAPPAAAPPGTAPGAGSPAPATPPARPATRTAAKATPKTTGPAAAAPRATPTTANHATTPAASPPATTRPTPTGTASTPTPTAKAAPGTLAVSPPGGTLRVPPGGTTISLTAQGGPVTWSSTVSSGLGTVHLSPTRGTISKGATITVTITASSTASGQQVTINPGGTIFTIFVTLA